MQPARRQAQSCITATSCHTNPVAFRLDNGGSLRSKRVTVDGAVRFDAVLTRTGVFTYSDGVKTWREYRAPEEVFAPASLASFELVPVTDDHPREFVTADNAEQYVKGRTAEGSIKRDGNNMVGALIIDDRKLLGKVDAGKAEVSNGYECVVIWGAGVSPEGERYDARQTEIVGNHVAVVDAGRAGNARLKTDARTMRTDSAIQIDEVPGMVPSANQTDATSAVQNRRDDAMNLEQALAALAAANKENGAYAVKLAAADKRGDDAEQRVKDITTTLTKAEAERDSAKTRADAADQKVKDADAAVAKAKTDAAAAVGDQVKARVDLLTKASAVGVKEIKRGDATVAVLDAEPNEIRLAVIAKIDGAEVPSEKRDNAAYVEARFDFAIESYKKSGKAFDQLNSIVNAPAKTTDTDVKPTGANMPSDREAQARKKMIADSANAHTITNTEGK